MIFAEPYGNYAHSELQYEIKQASQTNANPKWYRRLKIVQFSLAGYTVPQLTDLFEPCAATIRSYIKDYNQGGIEALNPKKSPGRPPKVGQLAQDDWAQIMSQTPNQYDKLQTDSRQWTLQLLVTYAKEYLDQDVCFQTISAALKRCGYRTGRSKLRVGSPDPDYQVKRERVESLRSLPSRGN